MHPVHSIGLGLPPLDFLVANHLEAYVLFMGLIRIVLVVQIGLRDSLKVSGYLPLGFLFLSLIFMGDWNRLLLWGFCDELDV